jgi:hypothetical protein
MTIQDLKDNREMIIATITEKVGEENVKSVMNQMVKGLDCCDSFEELIENAIFMALNFEVKVEKSKNAFILGRLNQIEIENN